MHPLLFFVIGLIAAVSAQSSISCNNAYQCYDRSSDLLYHAAREQILGPLITSVIFEDMIPIAYGLTCTVSCSGMPPPWTSHPYPFPFPLAARSTNRWPIPANTLINNGTSHIGVHCYAGGIGATDAYVPVWSVHTVDVDGNRRGGVMSYIPSTQMTFNSQSENFWLPYNPNDPAVYIKNMGGDVSNSKGSYVGACYIYGANSFIRT